MVSADSTALSQLSFVIEKIGGKLDVAVLGLNQSWDASQLSEPKAVKSLAANF